MEREIAFGEAPIGIPGPPLRNVIVIRGVMLLLFILLKPHIKYRHHTLIGI